MLGNYFREELVEADNFYLSRAKSARPGYSTTVKICGQASYLTQKRERERERKRERQREQKQKQKRQKGTVSLQHLHLTIINKTSLKIKIGIFLPIRQRNFYNYFNQ